jgi:hypothetical protein
MLCVSGVCVVVVQVALMGVVSSAVAAMDAHRGVAAVAEQGLALLRFLSRESANRVCARLCSVDSGQG